MGISPNASECHFPDYPCGTNQYHEDEIGNQKGAAAVKGDPCREHPEIAHADSGTHAGKDEPEPVCKRITFFHKFLL